MSDKRADLFRQHAQRAVALLAFSLQGHAPRWLTFVASNMLLAVSPLLVVTGCRRFLARPWAAYAGLAVLFAGLCYWTFAVPDFNARVTLVSVFHAVLYAARAAGRNRLMAATAKAA
ncbi:hypothetical protein NDK50_31205 [Paraburkholderia bryophila]|uniref:hypothetical protein n=1 Tax=Paraburkholderia bryophila TaxID=420952 RepID=UPI0023498505|nr:hypothetical protein [Paraburkholderia bryophila]WCM22481.1 hypothetical protein NDK50_31205 [Paraburkholderia bryophila]